MKNKWYEIYIFMCTGLFLAIGIGQQSGYLAQKLMVENSLRERITQALSKVIDESQYVVDVSVELKLSDAVEEQVTYFTEEKQEKTPVIKSNNPLGLQPSTNDMSSVPTTDSESMVGLPIPGFEFEVEQQPSENIKLELQPAPLDKRIQTEKREDIPNVLSKTSSFKRPSTAQIIKQEISIILQEGSSPELIENIRQLVMMASRYNRSRGDVLSIMTASFKKRRDVKSAEQVMLKALVEKIESLEVEKSKPTEKIKGYGQKDVESYKKTIQRLGAIVDSVQIEEKERLRRQEFEKAILPYKEEAEKLRQEISLRSYQQGTQEEGVDTLVQEKEKRIGEINNRIDDILAMLEGAQSDLEKQENGGVSNTILIVSLVIGVFLIVLLAVFFSLQGKSRNQYPPPPWMYPPRRPKKKTKKKIGTKEQENGSTQREGFSLKQEKRSTEIEDDASVVRSEINDMKKSVVSMSVGQPGAAAKIVKEWMEDDIPPPEPESNPISRPEEDSKKAKKKKKK